MTAAREFADRNFCEINLDGVYQESLVGFGGRGRNESCDDYRSAYYCISKYVASPLRWLPPKQTKIASGPPRQNREFFRARTQREG
jgi:hypothetical protein